MRHKISKMIEGSVLQENILKGKEYTDMEIEIDISAKVAFDSSIFNSCTFYVLPKSNLTIQDSEINNSKFIGSSGVITSDLGILNISDNSYVEKKQIEIKGSFNSINLYGVMIDSYIDTSKSLCMNMIRCEFKGFNIKGECDYLRLETNIFFSQKSKYSEWKKRIRKDAKCSETVFENVKVDPFFLATKCADKSSLDLSGATLVDKWSYLRKKYAGINLFIVFFFTLIFFLPLITHSFLLLLMSKIDSSTVYLDKIYLWEALAFGGKDGICAYLYCTLTMFLIVYNIGRVWLTLSIAKLREEELFLSDSGFNLNSIHPDKYKRELKIDKYLKIMFGVTLIYSCLKLWDVAWIIVPNF